MTTTIIHGPQACGKTSAAGTFARRFGCSHLADDWNGRDPLPDGALALTNQSPAHFTAPRGAVVLGFHQALRLL